MQKGDENSHVSSVRDVWLQGEGDGYLWRSHEVRSCVQCSSTILPVKHQVQGSVAGGVPKLHRPGGEVEVCETRRTEELGFVYVILKLWSIKLVCNPTSIRLHMMPSSSPPGNLTRTEIA